MDLQGELNRLIGNRVPNDQWSAAGAASLWASGAVGMELVGALNLKAGLPVNGTSLELNGVLKRLGFDLDSNGALVGGVDGTTNVANVLRLPGAVGNYVSTPDSSALSFSGDTDFRIRIAEDNWVPSASNMLISKRGAAGQRSWYWWVDIAQGMGVGVSTDGTAESFYNTSGGAFTFAPGSVKWLRWTRVAATGVNTWYTSDDGSTWTQYGSPATGITGALFDNTPAVELGSRLGGTLEMNTGRLYYAELRNGIAGNVVASFDASTVAVRGDQSPTTWAGPQGNTWTINGTAWWWGVYTGTQLRTKSLRLPGTAGNYASTPDSAALSITGDIDIRVKVAPDDWTPTVTQAFVGKMQSASTRSYYFEVFTNGRLQFTWSVDGTAVTGSKNSTVSVPFADGAVGWVRAVLDVDNGAAGNDVLFYTSTDGVTWTQLGTTITTAGTTSIFDTTVPVEIGSRGGGATNPLAGNVYYAEIRNGIGGSVVGAFNPETVRPTGSRTPTTVLGPTGAVWTINGIGWSWIY